MDKKYRSYEIEILNYFDEKNLRQYKEYLLKLFVILPDNSLVSIYKKIKKNYNMLINDCNFILIKNKPC